MYGYRCYLDDEQICIMTTEEKDGVLIIKCKSVLEDSKKVLKERIKQLERLLEENTKTVIDGLK